MRRHMERLAAEGVDVVRVIYPDLIGTDRARDVLVDHLPSAREHGLAFCRAVYHTTPQGDVVPVAGGLDAGLPDVTVRPDLSVARTDNDHVTFGKGSPHLCLGNLLARTEIRIMFEELIPRIAGIRPAGDVPRVRSNFVNGIKKLPVEVTLA
ncbi:hypothetical protein GCM10022233_35640 [Streptomyces shaanxiensis]|uniref:Cytochrome P450 n=1 Tax=Streptomyces shaanxiensis TaxID=653357 RepID=A0ABP7V553_9ACTN